jgi:hypothetical protein
MRFARCSLGHLGVVTDRKEVTYPDGTSAVAWTGRHVLPLHLLGRPWSSRSPRWGLVGSDHDAMYAWATVFVALVFLLVGVMLLLG